MLITYTVRRRFARSAIFLPDPTRWFGDRMRLSSSVLLLRDQPFPVRTFLLDVRFREWLTVVRRDEAAPTL